MCVCLCLVLFCCIGFLCPFLYVNHLAEKVTERAGCFICMNSFVCVCVIAALYIVSVQTKLQVQFPQIRIELKISMYRIRVCFSL